MQNRILAILFIFAFVLVSCDSNQVYDNYKSLPNVWNKDSVVSFKVNPPDSINGYNLFVNLRNNNGYKYSNLFLIVEMVYPHGKTIKDTLEYKMAKPNGELLGTGFADIKENKLWYKGYEYPFVFSEKGEYTVNIQQAMREAGEVNGVANLEGITDVGFRIEKTKTPN
ncbi:gliding motility lipoprotein GldH [Mangrovimonas aestuarii]|uniref:gliding motility lipoprotein GldH n=1 Tax=Mangrovimonas aestuarii TaxID=3018443 RepID=UPI002378163A|nr:gliding motility lipoprotein GldH [Mangrovimonas aestuarii]